MFCYILHNSFSVIATIPRVAFNMRSCTNVAKTDDRFCPNYMTKYTAGSDEKRIALFSGKDSQHVHVKEGDIQNLKISGQRIINSRIEKDLKGKHGLRNLDPLLQLVV